MCHYVPLQGMNDWGPGHMDHVDERLCGVQINLIKFGEVWYILGRI